MKCDGVGWRRSVGPSVRNEVLQRVKEGRNILKTIN